jgi:hypothetical protein
MKHHNAHGDPQHSQYRHEQHQMSKELRRDKMSMDGYFQRSCSGFEMKQIEIVSREMKQERKKERKQARENETLQNKKSIITTPQFAIHSSSLHTHTIQLCSN